MTDFVLSVYEIESALRLAGKIRINPKKAAIQSVFLAAGCVLFTYYAVIAPENRLYPVIAAVSAAFAALVWVLPRLRGRKLSKAAYTGRKIAVSFSEASLRVEPEGKQPWEIPLDGSLPVRENELLFVLFLENGQLLILPKRAFEKEDLSRLSGLTVLETDD